MSKQEIFDFLKENLKIKVNHDINQSWGEESGSTTSVYVAIQLTNPETGEIEDICNDSSSSYISGR